MQELTKEEQAWIAQWKQISVFSIYAGGFLLFLGVMGVIYVIKNGHITDIWILALWAGFIAASVEAIYTGKEFKRVIKIIEKLTKGQE